METNKALQKQKLLIQTEGTYVLVNTSLKIKLIFVLVLLLYLLLLFYPTSSVFLQGQCDSFFLRCDRESDRLRRFRDTLLDRERERLGDRDL